MNNLKKEDVVIYLEEKVREFQMDIDFNEEHEGKYNNGTLKNRIQVLERAITILEK